MAKMLLFKKMKPTKEGKQYPSYFTIVKDEKGDEKYVGVKFDPNLPQNVNVMISSFKGILEGEFDTPYSLEKYFSQVKNKWVYPYFYVKKIDNYTSVETKSTMNIPKPQFTFVLDESNQPFNDIESEE